MSEKNFIKSLLRLVGVDLSTRLVASRAHDVAARLWRAFLQLRAHKIRRMVPRGFPSVTIRLPLAILITAIPIALYAAAP
ncbi:MAG: hypothetical protein QME32_03580, partial [Endomicrobiia bacterium]|nr:hypothetical protein [Endomicrobiia bacterium]